MNMPTSSGYTIENMSTYAMFKIYHAQLRVAGEADKCDIADDGFEVNDDGTI